MAIQLENSIRTPALFTAEPYQTLQDYQVQKVAAVGLACFAFFSLQWGMALGAAAGIGLACSAITLVSETFLRKFQFVNINWGQLPNLTQEIMMNVAIRIVVLPTVLALCVASGVVPLQIIATYILAGNIKVILLASIIGPLTEEILYRGFVQERLEDIVTLIDRHLHPVGDLTKKRCCAAIQSALFGAIHIIGGQVVKGVGSKVITFCMTSAMGYYKTHLKDKYESLIPSIAIHNAHNTGYVLGLLASKMIPRAI